MKTAYATIKEFELMRMFKKGQMDIWHYGQGLLGEIRLIERCFHLGDSALADVMKIANVFFENQAC